MTIEIVAVVHKKQFKLAPYIKLPTKSIQPLLLSGLSEMKLALLSGLWSSLRILNMVKSFAFSIELRISMALSIENLSPPSVESIDCGLLLLSLLSLCLDISMKLLIASVISPRDSPFLFFHVELAVWDGSFPARLLPYHSTGVGSSSTSSPLSASIVTCAPCVRKAALSSRSSSLLGAGWEEEICRNLVTVPVLNSCPSRS